MNQSEMLQWIEDNVERINTYPVNGQILTFVFTRYGSVSIAESLTEAVEQEYYQTGETIELEVDDES